MRLRHPQPIWHLLITNLIICCPFGTPPPTPALQVPTASGAWKHFKGSLAAHSGVWKTFFIFHFHFFFNLLQNTKNVTCEYEFVVVFCSRSVVVAALARLPAASVVVVLVVVVAAWLSAFKLKRAPTAENKLTLNVKFIEIVYVGAAIVLLLFLLLLFSACCCYCFVVVYRMPFEHILQAIGKGSCISLSLLAPSCNASFLLQIRLRLLRRPFPANCSRVQRGLQRSLSTLRSPHSPPACLSVWPTPVRVRVSPQLRFLFALLE